MKIAIHCTAWRRPTIMQKAFTALERTRKQFADHGIETFVVVAVSEKKSEGICRKFGYETVWVDNSPLGRKFDAAMQKILSYDFDYCMEYGSDNVLAEEYVPAVLQCIEHGIPWIAMRSFYIQNNRTREVRLFHERGTSNIGRLTRRYLLMQTLKRKGFLFEHRASKALDTSIQQTISSVTKQTPHILRFSHPLILDIKDQNSMHSYESFAQMSTVFPVVPLVGTFPEIETKSEQ